MNDISNPEGKPPRKRVGPGVARAALIVALIAPVLMLVGALGSKFGVFGYQVGLLAVALGVILLIIGGVVGLVALVLVLRAPERRGLAPALIAMAGGLVAAALIFNVVSSLPKNPGIHDVATDWTQPIMFSAKTMAERGAKSNPVEPNPTAHARGGTAGKPISEINAATCAAAKPLILPLAPHEAMAKVQSVVKSEGLRLINADAGTGMVEAVDSTFWFGFKDDVAFRVRPEGAGSRIDLRSISRVGGGDLGANCKRIARLKTALAG